MRTEPAASARNMDDSHHQAEHGARRKPADADQVEQFRSLFVQAGAVNERDGHAAADPAAEALTRRKASETEAAAFDAGWLHPAQRVLLDNPAAQAGAAPPPAVAATLADLLERHVRQLAVSDSLKAQGGDGQVLLRLSDASLPGTDLLLSRSAQGWQLRVESTRADSAGRAERGAAELISRFEERRLGALQVEVVRRD